MNKQTMIKNYRKYSKADKYIVGFEYKKNIYAIALDEIPPRFIKVEKESSRKGGKAKLQLRLNNQYMEQLIRKGAECICQPTDLIGKYNKGVMFEKFITEEYFGQEWQGKDNTPFYISGDIKTENGAEIQIKFNGAQIVVESTLEKLKRLGAI